MIYLNQLKDCHIYKNPFLFPKGSNKNKRKGNTVFLLTPNIDSSIELMKNPLIKDNKYYRSYYIERDVSYYINTESNCYNLIDSAVCIHEQVFGENVHILNENGKYVQEEQFINFQGDPENIDDAKEYITVDRINELSKRIGLDLNIQYTVLFTKNAYETRIARDVINYNRILDYFAYTHTNSDDIVNKEEYYDWICGDIIVGSIGGVSFSDTERLYLSSYVANIGVISYNNDIDIQSGYIDFCRTIEDAKSRLSSYEFIKYLRNKGFNNQIEESTLMESESPFTTIKRNITRSIRKGGDHELNNTTDNIEIAAKVGKSNSDSDTSEVSVSTPEDILNQIKGAVPSIPTPKVSSESVECFDYRCLTEDVIIEEDMIKAGNVITYFNEANVKNINPILYKMLYKERIRTNKDLFLYYKYVKENVTTIDRAFINYSRYKLNNIFIDLFYYNELFFKNNIYKLDRGVDLYQAFLYRAMHNVNYIKSGYDEGVKTVLIPVKDWMDNIKTKSYLYTHEINPISVITRMLQKDPSMVRELFGGANVVFLTNKVYFKVNFDNMIDYPMFINSLKKLYMANPEEFAEEVNDSKEAIVDKIVDDIENSQQIKIHHLTGRKADKTVSKDEQPADKTIEVNKDRQDRIDAKKKELVNKIEKAAEESPDVDNTLDKLDEDDEFKKMLLQLADEEQNGIQINNSRAARMDTLNDALLDKQINGRTVKDILASREDSSSKELTPMELPIDSINEEWKHLTYASMNNSYDPQGDIVASLRWLSTTSYPIAIRNIDVQDTSTSEDFIYTYTVELENHEGKRSKLRFDIPKLMNNQYMKLRGNKKVIATQSFLMPVLKTEEDTVQIISNYNKIFIYKAGASQAGKSNPACDRLVKALNKGPFKDIKITEGNNAIICSRYDLPIDYIDLAGIYTRIDTKFSHFIFNYKELLNELEENKLKVDYNSGIPIGYRTENMTKEIIYYSQHNKDYGFRYLAHQVAMNLYTDSQEFKEAFDNAKQGTKYAYSQASILSSRIPVILLLGYNMGLTKALNLSGINYSFVEKKDRAAEASLDKGYIAFADGFLEFEETPTASLLVNGLRDKCDTKFYSIADMNKKSTFLELLDNFTERIKTDGLDNFADCLVDPITQDVCKHYNLPDSYCELLIYGSSLLVDNKYIKHGEQPGRRLRRNELIAAYFYKALSGAYGSYATSYRHGRETILSMKQSAVIDLLMSDPTSQDLSIINALNEKESYDTVTTKGLSGMNSDRSYSLDKRAYDETMINILGISTGFAATVGINRQATINSNVHTTRGYIVPSLEKDMNSVNTLCMSEALTPMGTTRDDPFRTAMTFIQTTRHGMRVAHADPCLITNGADKALPYLISDIFAFKAKDDGEVVELKEDSHMIIKYKSGECDYVDLSTKVEKNSSNGFYVTLKLDTDLKIGSKVKQGTIIAYDRESFDPSVGIDDDPAYKIGTLSMCALMVTDEGFEDSAKINSVLSECMTSDISEQIEIAIDKNANVYNILPPGTNIKEGDILMQMQRSYDEEDANALLKTLAADEDEISNLGRRPIKSPVTGIVQDIKIMRTCELDEMSDSLRALCKKYESRTASKRADMKKYGIEKEYELDPNYKLPATGKMKNVESGVKVIFTVTYHDKMGVGDKLIYWSANKGVVKDVFPINKEPYLLGHPERKLAALVSIDSVNGRMVCSIQNVGVATRLLIEAAWKAQTMAGIKVDYAVPSMNDLKK